MNQFTSSTSPWQSAMVRYLRPRDWFADALWTLSGPPRLRAAAISHAGGGGKGEEGFSRRRCRRIPSRPRT